jgi:hypothetical protein
MGSPIDRHDYPPTPTPVSLLYPRNRQLSPRVRVFIHRLARRGVCQRPRLMLRGRKIGDREGLRTAHPCRSDIRSRATQVKLKRIGPTGATGSTSNNGNLYGRAGAITGVPIGVMARQRATCPGIPWNIPPPCGSISRAQRVSLTTRQDAAAATRAIALASTACGQRPCGKWNSGLLPTSVT